jgi:hypothetical protein
MLDSSKLSEIDMGKFEESCNDMRAFSGSRTSKDALVCFLYLLLRDVTVPGLVEQKVTEAVFATDKEGEVSFTNGWLFDYARDIATRLTEK